MPMEIFFYIIYIMDVQQKNIEDNDNSHLKIKPKTQVTYNQEKFKPQLLINNQQHMFRMTDSRVTKLSDQNASNTVSRVSTPTSSIVGYTCKEEKRHTPIDTRLSATPLFSNNAINGSKTQNMNITPSLNLARNLSTSQSRKFKIFNEPLQINFQLPPLSQYYTKNRYENDMNASMGPSEAIATKQPNNLNNLNYNNSILDFRYSTKLPNNNLNPLNNYNNNSILDFRYSQRGSNNNRPSIKPAKTSNLNPGNIINSINGLNMSGLTSSKNLQASNAEKIRQYKDQIKQQEENKEEDKISRKYSDTVQNNFGKYFKQIGKKNNIIFMVISFVFAVIFMLLGRLLL